MDVGIIIIFKDKASILKNLWLQKTRFRICIINNGSKDDTFIELQKLEKRTTFTLYILDVKKDKGLRKAINAGKRFFENTLNIDTTAYIDGNKYSHIEELNEVLTNIPEKEITLESSLRIKQALSFSDLQIV